MVRLAASGLDQLAEDLDVGRRAPVAGVDDAGAPQRSRSVASLIVCHPGVTRLDQYLLQLEAAGPAQRVARNDVEAPLDVRIGLPEVAGATIEIGEQGVIRPQVVLVILATHSVQALEGGGRSQPTDRRRRLRSRHRRRPRLPPDAARPPCCTRTNKTSAIIAEQRSDWAR